MIVCEVLFALELSVQIVKLRFTLNSRVRTKLWELNDLVHRLNLIQHVRK